VPLPKEQGLFLDLSVYGTLCRLKETANLFRLFPWVAFGKQHTKGHYEKTWPFISVSLRILMPPQGNSQSFPAVSLGGVWQTTYKEPLRKNMAIYICFGLRHLMPLTTAYHYSYALTAPYAADGRCIVIVIL